MKTNEKIQKLITDWMTNPRWKGVKRPYTAEEVVKLQELNTFKECASKVGSESLSSKLKGQSFGTDFNRFSGHQFIKYLTESSACRITVKDSKSSKKEVVRKLIDARLAADVIGNSSIIIAKINVNNKKKIVKENKILNGFFLGKNNLKEAIEKAISYAPYSDMICLETKNLEMEQAREFAKIIHAKYPSKSLVYGGLSFVKDSMVENVIKKDLFKMGYRFMLTNSKNNLELKKDNLIKLKCQDLDERMYFDAV
jgi:isocitrate lyase